MAWRAFSGGLSCTCVLLWLSSCLPYGVRVDTAPAPSAWLASETGHAGAGHAEAGQRADPAQVLPAGALAAGQSAMAYRIDLPTVLRLVGKRSIVVELAASRAREAQHRASAQLLRLLPALNPRVTFARTEGRVQATRGEFVEVKRQQGFLGAGLELAIQPADALWRVAEERRLERSAGASLRATRNRSHAEAAASYFAFVRAAAEEKIAAGAVKAATELVNVEQARERGGLALPSDLARARARLAETEREAALAKREFQRIAAQLREILRIAPELELIPELEDAAAQIVLVESSRTLRSLLDEAERRRPELRAAGELIAARKAARKREGSSWLFPALRLGAGYGYFGPNLGNREDQENYWAGLAWSLDFGIRARHAAAKEREFRAELQREAALRRIQREVGDARERIVAAKVFIRAAREESAAARESLAQQQARFKQGEAQLLEVLDAQVATARAASALVTAIAELNTAQYALFTAIGGPQQAH